MKKFHAERNFYIAAIGLIVWSVAWRLKVLTGQGQLTSPVRKANRSFAHRMGWAVGAFVLLAIADVPICRINYLLTINTFVTPRKEALLREAVGCEDVFLESATGNATGKCNDFCREALMLSEERNAAIVWARKWHVMGRKSAELFDNMRGVQQGSDRIENMFQKKSCAKVLRSVDKANVWVNAFNVILACFCVAGCMEAFANALSAGEVTNEKKD